MLQEDFDYWFLKTGRDLLNLSQVYKMWSQVILHDLDENFHQSCELIVEGVEDSRSVERS